MRQAKGICLIEILITCIISSIIILALLTAQMHSLQISNQIQINTKALNLVINTCELWLAQNYLDVKQFNYRCRLTMPSAHCEIRQLHNNTLFFISWPNSTNYKLNNFKFSVG